MKFAIIVALFGVAAANYGGATRESSSGYGGAAVRSESGYGGSMRSDSGYGGSMRSDSGYGGASRAAPVAITSYTHDIVGSDSSNLRFETGNGIRQSESTQVLHGRGGTYQDEFGQMVQSDSGLSKSGQYSYTSPEGQHIATSWTADENGFQATGDHLPTSPPIPAEIAASLRSSSSYGGYESAPMRSAPASYAAPMRSAPAYTAPVRSAPAYAAPVRSAPAPSYAAPAPLPVRSSVY